MEKRHRKIFSCTWILILLAISCDDRNETVTYRSIAGIYTCRESSPHAGVRSYIVEIDSVADEKDLYIISNFHNLGENEFLFTTRVSDTLYLFNQPIADLTVNGEGFIGDRLKTILFYYSTDDGITRLDYTARYSR